MIITYRYLENKFIKSVFTMKKLLFGAAAVLLMASCTGSGNSESKKGIDKETTEPTTETANQEMSSTPVDTLAVNDKNEDTQQDKAALEQSARDFITDMYAVVLKSNNYPVNTTYFTSEFVNLYNKTEKIEGKRMSESDSDGGMDEQFFDDEFWSSYNDDPKGAKAKITKVTVDENNNGAPKASVIVKLIPEGNESPIKINLVMTEDGWKISDYRGFKKPMQRYIKS